MQRSVPLIGVCSRQPWKSITVSPKNDWWLKVIEHIERRPEACPLDSESLGRLFLQSAIDGKPSTQFDDVLRGCDHWTSDAMEKGLYPFLR